MHSQNIRRVTLGAFALMSVAACSGTGDSGSTQTAQATQARDSMLTQQNVILQAQKDSLILAARGLFDAMSAIDSATALAGVKGAKGSKVEGGVAYEVGVRQRTIAALQRLRSAEKRLNASIAKVKKLGNENSSLKAELATFQEAAVALQGQIAAQQQRLDLLTTQLNVATARGDSLDVKSKQLGSSLDSAGVESRKVYVVAGTKDYLLKNNVVTEAGGTRFPFIVRVGESLKPVNGNPPTTVFKQFDKLAERTIQLEPNKRYEVVSNQDLNAVDHSNAKGRVFTGPIKITDPDRFWQSSSYLILREL